MFCLALNIIVYKRQNWTELLPRYSSFPYIFVDNTFKPLKIISAFCSKNYSFLTIEHSDQKVQEPKEVKKLTETQNPEQKKNVYFRLFFSFSLSFLLFFFPVKVDQMKFKKFAK